MIDFFLVVTWSVVPISGLIARCERRSESLPLPLTLVDDERVGRLAAVSVHQTLPQLFLPPDTHRPQIFKVRKGGSGGNGEMIVVVVVLGLCGLRSWKSVYSFHPKLDRARFRSCTTTPSDSHQSYHYHQPIAYNGAGLIKGKCYSCYYYELIG